MPVSPRTVEGLISDMTTDVTTQLTVALKAANVFSICLHESIDTKDNPHLAVVPRYCSNGDVHEELCRLKPMYDTTKGKDILDTFTKNFEERRIDIKKISSVVMMGQYRGSVTLVEQKIGNPVIK